jgi:hypothetical protein
LARIPAVLCEVALHWGDQSLDQVLPRGEDHRRQRRQMDLPAQTRSHLPLAGERFVEASADPEAIPMPTRPRPDFKLLPPVGLPERISSRCGDLSRILWLDSHRATPNAAQCFSIFLQPDLVDQRSRRTRSGTGQSSRIKRSRHTVNSYRFGVLSSFEHLKREHIFTLIIGRKPSKWTFLERFGPGFFW